eukprot:TRINITY_DN1120_c0_g1_i4.p2 TRINITY_DN1120_c0_g1~~TRINITY_DN1120_c0_g1_i4.p2  ORF type:complete len:202 (-),score=17.06 TRINITY_DN1120_c0_g1_i4:119-724(-)
MSSCAIGQASLGNQIRINKCQSRNAGSLRLQFNRGTPQRLNRRQIAEVLCAKGRGSKYKTPQRQTPPVPDVDPVNEEIVVFVKPSKLPTWLPYSLIKCSPAANGLIRNMTTNWGKTLFGNTLIRNIAKEVYKQEKEIVEQITARYKEYAQFKDFQFAIKIRDKTKPAEWYLPDKRLIVLPPQEELGKAPLEILVEKFTGQQ